MSRVSINKFLSSINFKQVAYVQALSQENWPEPVSQIYGEQRTALVFTDGTVFLSGQPLDYYRALAHGRMLDIPCAATKTAEKTKRLVPLDAIHHLELVSECENIAEVSSDDCVEPAGALKLRQCIIAPAFAVHLPSAVRSPHPQRPLTACRVGTRPSFEAGRNLPLTVVQNRGS